MLVFGDLVSGEVPGVLSCFVVYLIWFCFCCCLFNPFLVFGDLVSGEITGAANGLLDAAVDENV